MERGKGLTRCVALRQRQGGELSDDPAACGFLRLAAELVFDLCLLRSTVRQLLLARPMQLGWLLFGI